MTSVLEPAPTPIDPSAFWDHEAAALRDRARLEPDAWWWINREFATRDAAKTKAYELRHGLIRAFRPTGQYDATADGLRVKARFVGRTG